MSKGYLTFAQNNSKTDYLRLAYVQALSIKATQKINQCAVVVDDATFELITDQHREVFDYIIRMPYGDDAVNDQWKLKNEWKAYVATPFDETVKLESDMLFTYSVDHWWDTMSTKELCFTTQVLDYRGNIATSREYRQVFDQNNLLNVYNGFYYFKKTELTRQFFDIAKILFRDWDQIKNTLLVDAENEPGSTDVVFAVACKLVGDQNCYLPGAVPTFTHMKGAINGWQPNTDWRDQVYNQLDGSRLTVGFQRQRVPFHYYQKGFITNELLEYYERRYRETRI
jgi:hypothetical protein